MIGKIKAEIERLKKIAENNLKDEQGIETIICSVQAGVLIECLKWAEETKKILLKEFCVCKEITNEKESAYKRIQEEMNDACSHHIIEKAFNGEQK